jgi:phytoene/squalene synthetase
MNQLYNKVTAKSSQMVTHAYSTSFSLGVRMLPRKQGMAIHGVYGFVRFADEIVDTFHHLPKAEVLNEFRKETDLAIERHHSMNPIIHSFQRVYHEYGVEREVVDAFLDSMAMDLNDVTYERKSFDEYIYGSAEVVGLMCLSVFCDGDKDLYESLKPEARSLGAAFQKVNFLRDLKHDKEELGRVYFPGVDLSGLGHREKMLIENEIEEDFAHAFEGIKKLPRKSRLGVYLAYRYYLLLFRKIKRTPASEVMETRIRIDNSRKMLVLVQSYFRARLNWL